MPRFASRSRTGGRLASARPGARVRLPIRSRRRRRQSSAGFSKGLFSVVLPWAQKSTNRAKFRTSPIMRKGGLDGQHLLVEREAGTG